MDAIYRINHAGERPDKNTQKKRQKRILPRMDLDLPKSSININYPASSLARNSDDVVDNNKSNILSQILDGNLHFIFFISSDKYNFLITLNYRSSK